MTNAFANAVKGVANKGRTHNGAVTLQSSLDKCVDLFFMIGNRAKDFTNEFHAAFREDPDIATRILLWARDPRGGAGERETFRIILRDIEKQNFQLFKKILPHVPRLGRWDDILVARTAPGQRLAAKLVKEALESGDKLCAKWMPREHTNNATKRKQAAALAKYVKLSPRNYRKLLASASSTVEQNMCAKEWKKINYEHVPSLASARYQKAFMRNDQVRYDAYSSKLEKGEVKVNASALYPYDVIKSIRSGGKKAVIQAQWDSLPNYLGSESILPIVDTSASMTWFQVAKGIQGLDVAASLGLYCSEKNSGPFKDMFMTFSTSPRLRHLTGSVEARLNSLMRGMICGGTDIEAAFRLVLKTGLQNRVPDSDMPRILLILSDMEFNSCTRNPSATAFEDLKRQYAAAGYTMPKVVFWNLNSRAGNVPVESGTNGTALVSGFSPSILRGVLSSDMDSFTPKAVMLSTVGIDRYDIS